MSEHANGTFTLDVWDAEEPYDRHGDTRIGRVHIEKTFRGDLVGTSTTELITVHTTAGPAAYVGVERFEGTVHGCHGGFVFQHNAGSADGGQWLTWKIVQTSGTGELTGITGEGQIIIEEGGGHAFTLDYELA